MTAMFKFRPDVLFTNYTQHMQLQKLQHQKRFPVFSLFFLMCLSVFLHIAIFFLLQSFDLRGLQSNATATLKPAVIAKPENLELQLYVDVDVEEKSNQQSNIKVANAQVNAKVIQQPKPLNTMLNPTHAKATYVTKNTRHFVQQTAAAHAPKPMVSRISRHVSTAVQSHAPAKTTVAVGEQNHSSPTPSNVVAISETSETSTSSTSSTSSTTAVVSTFATPKTSATQPSQSKNDTTLAHQTPTVEKMNNEDARYLGGQPAYPQLARMNEEQGTVTLKVQINAQGKAQAIIIVKSSGFNELDQAAKRHIEHSAFKPAVYAGVASSSWLLVPVRFYLS